MATGYTDSPSGATLDLLLPSHTDDAPVASHALSTAMTHALDVELHQHMDQQHAQLQLEQQQQQAAAAAAAAVPSSPFSAPSSNPAFAGTGPAPAAAPVAAAGLLTAPRLERVSVKARLLIAADGPMSLLRQQCVGDGEPDFEVRVWEGGRCCCVGMISEVLLWCVVQRPDQAVDALGVAHSARRVWRHAHPSEGAAFSLPPTPSRPHPSLASHPRLCSPLHAPAHTTTQTLTTTPGHGAVGWSAAW